MKRSNTDRLQRVDTGGIELRGDGFHKVDNVDIGPYGKL